MPAAGQTGTAPPVERPSAMAPQASVLYAAATRRTPSSQRQNAWKGTVCFSTGFATRVPYRFRPLGIKGLREEVSKNSTAKAAVSKS